jgi:hypothetical protein
MTESFRNADDAKAAIRRYIDKRLKEWAAWFKQRTPLCAGYPKASPEHQMMKMGIMPREKYRPPTMPVNEEAEEIENLLNDMMKQCHEAAEAIRCMYLKNGELKDKAKSLGVSRSKLVMHLLIDRWWLAGRLSLKGEVKLLMVAFRSIRKKSK